MNYARSMSKGWDILFSMSESTCFGLLSDVIGLAIRGGDFPADDNWYICFIYFDDYCAMIVLLCS